MRTRFGRGSLAIAVLGPLLGTPAAAATAKTFTLVVSGQSGARYDGTCIVTTASGDERLALEGLVPLERVFVGEAVSCRFRVEGRVVVEVIHDGSRSRSATSDGSIQVSAR